MVLVVRESTIEIHQFHNNIILRSLPLLHKEWKVFLIIAERGTKIERGLTDVNYVRKICFDQRGPSTNRITLLRPLWTIIYIIIIVEGTSIRDGLVIMG